MSDYLTQQNEMRRLERIARKVKQAEKSLGPLTTGQRSGLILDNFPEVYDSEHARYILAALEDLGMIHKAVKTNNL